MVKNIDNIDYSNHKIKKSNLNSNNTNLDDYLLNSVQEVIINNNVIEEMVMESSNNIYQDRIKGDYKGYDSDCLDIIASREHTRDEYGNWTGLAYNNKDELVNDLDKLKDIYSDYEGFAYYNQNIYPENYKYDSIQEAGCCPTCFAMVATYLTGNNTFPTDVVEDFNPYCYETGTDVTGECFPDICEKYNIKPNRLDVHNKEQLLSELGEGNPIILNVIKGNFTGSGHYITLLGLDNNGDVIVADPNNVANSVKSYPIDLLMNQANDTNGAAWSFEMNK